MGARKALRRLGRARDQRSRRPWLAVVGVLVVLAVAGVGVAAAVNGAGAPRPFFRPPGSPPITPVAAPEPALAQSMAVFRRARGGSDLLPAQMSHRFYAEFGANPALARHALTTHLGEPVYLLPASGGVCFADTNAAGCMSSDQLANGEAENILMCAPDLSPSLVEIVMLLPDGVTDVRAQLADRSSVPFEAGENAYVLDQAKNGPIPTTITWRSASGSHSLPAHVPSDIGSESCGGGLPATRPELGGPTQSGSDAADPVARVPGVPGG
jgi:hypothetical protein